MTSFSFCLVLWSVRWGLSPYYTSNFCAKQKKNKKIRGISAKKVGLSGCVSGNQLENWKIKAADSIIF